MSRRLFDIDHSDRGRGPSVITACLCDSGYFNKTLRNNCAAIIAQSGVMYNALTGRADQTAPAAQRELAGRLTCKRKTMRLPDFAAYFAGE